MVPRACNAIRTPAPSPRLLGLDRMQPVARQRGSVQLVAACASVAGSCTGGTRLQPSACGCNTLRCVTHVLPRIGRCPGGQQWKAQMSARDGFGCGADVGGGRTLSRCRGGQGIDLVPVQTWVGGGLVGDRLVRKAEVGGGRTLSRCRGGQGIDSVQLLKWVGVGLGPGADVGGYEPSPVVSDERSPKTQMRAYRGEPYQSALRCAHCAATDAAACNCRWIDAAGGASLQAALRCNQFRFVQLGPLQGCSGGALGVLWGYSRSTLGVL
jgi:hypothetical protein